MTWTNGGVHRANTAEWRKLRKQILERDHYMCMMQCGKTADTVDHIIPWYQTQDDSPANLRSLCTPCHRIKTAAEGQQARAERRKHLKRAPKRHPAA